MVLKMEDKELIRRLVNIQGLSQREVFRRFGWSRDSIADAIKNPEPNAYTLQCPRPHYNQVNSRGTGVESPPTSSLVGAQASWLSRPSPVS